MKLLYMALGALFFLTACGGPERVEEWKKWREENGKVKVLATIAMISDLAKTVGGDHVDVLTLITGELDPHSYQLVKGDDEKFAHAQLIFFNGLSLEHGPSLQQQLYNNAKGVGLGDSIQHAYPELILRYKGQTDPHIWMDVQLWAKGIPFMVEALSKLDPAHANEYQKNGEQLAADLLHIHDDIMQVMHTIPDDHRYLVTSHDAFNYFTKAYLATPEEQATNTWQPRFAAPEGLAPESQLSATDIQEIIDHLATYKIHIVFPESNVSKDSIRKIVQAAKEKGLNVHMADCSLYADAIGKPGSDGDSYVKMMQHNAKTIAHFLSQEKNHDN